MKRRDLHDLLGGLILLLLGLIAVIQGCGYDIGTLASMGPGYFPIALGVLLMLGGAAMLALAVVARSEREQKAAIDMDWRGGALIIIGLIGFVILGRWGGLLPATFALVFISALGDRKNTVVGAITLALAMVAIAGIVFHWLLRVPFPLFSWG